MKIALTPWELALSGLCIVLGGAILYECAAPLQAFTPPALELKKHQAVATTAFFSPPSEASFAAIDARPLFSPTRKPIDVPQAAGGPAGSGPSAPPPLLNVVLVGVILDGEKQLALVKVQGAPFAASLKVGATLDGWQVKEIASDKVVFHAGTAEQVLGLGDQRASQSQPAQTGMRSGIAPPSAPQAAIGPQPKPVLPTNGQRPLPQSGSGLQ